MRKVKLIIDDKEVQLTDEQLKVLGIEKEEKRKNPFERVAIDDMYYFINHFGDVNGYRQADDYEDDRLFNNFNYFNDKQFANQVGLHQLLYRKLLEFAYDNGFVDTQEWNEKNQHWTIYYNHNRHKFEADNWGTFHRSDVYFSSEDGAKTAIKEVVEPFVNEHPEFKW